MGDHLMCIGQLVYFLLGIKGQSLYHEKFSTRHCGASALGIRDMPVVMDFVTGSFVRDLLPKCQIKVIAKLKLYIAV